MERKAEFTKIFDAYYPKVFRLCKGYFNGDEQLALDTSQEVFLKVWENINSFKQDSELGTWIYKIAVNTCLMQIRKDNSRKEKNFTPFFQLLSENYSYEEELKIKKMYDCIQKLDERGKVIILMVLDEVPYPQIAKIIGIKEDALRVNIHRIKKKLTLCVQNGEV
ncbi:sigma-70 family RNA polymerase sigma factor [Algoriphagus confluentis]|uniref:Sigma-70 family RNA polymerase sigma factor n=1 Tax=Algoriphagus confluentis TaxID=1697556 RepID=A0ABQ6PUE6_9BACT|nr:sigma-70 family RNA polymerase sigma factor [Algoriphagus confluentis]